MQEFTSICINVFIGAIRKYPDSSPVPVIERDHRDV